MPARKIYEDYYETGSTAKKRQLDTIYEEKSNRKTGKNVVNRPKLKRKSNILIFSFILTAFAMTMLITYRFNVISEKNLKDFDEFWNYNTLKDELNSVEAALLNSQIDVEQNTNLDEIEAYAKQKLGMQKPDKNQTVYIDTSDSTAEVEEGESLNFIEKIIEQIKDFINKIF